MTQLPPELLRKGRFDKLFFVAATEALELGYGGVLVVSRLCELSRVVYDRRLRKSARQIRRWGG